MGPGRNLEIARCRSSELSILLCKFISAYSYISHTISPNACCDRGVTAVTQVYWRCAVSVGGLPGAALCPVRTEWMGNHYVQDRRQLSIVHEQLRQSYSLRVPVGAVSQELPTTTALSTVWLTVPAGWYKRYRCDGDAKGRPSQSHSSRVGGQCSPSNASSASGIHNQDGWRRCQLWRWYCGIVTCMRCVDSLQNIL